MLRKQLVVALGMVTAIAVLVVAWAMLPSLPLPVPDGDDAAARLAFVGRWLLLPGLALFAGVATIANQRFFVAEAIDGERKPATASSTSRYATIETPLSKSLSR